MCPDCLAKSKRATSSFTDGADSEVDSQSEDISSDSEDGIEKISFDDIDEEEKFADLLLNVNFSSTQIKHFLEVHKWSSSACRIIF